MSSVQHKRSNQSNHIPTAEAIKHGEFAINYKAGEERVFIKNDEDNIVEFRSNNYYTSEFEKLKTNTELKFYCIEPVSVFINDEERAYDANSYVDIFFREEDTFEIVTTSDSSILSLNAYPGALDTFFPWLEGVQIFDSILFDMNSEEMYTKWNQGHQGQYKVQTAQYNNCVFWSDNPYISDVSLRTNYTLYSSAHLPLCYSTIPENTFKAFYSAYGVKFDPNWSNPAYRNSFAAATWATQVFSYYGAQTIGVFNMDSSLYNITLPKDCRGLMFSSPCIEYAGVFNAINTTNFGAKSGSWRDAFAYCSSLKELYIKNLKANLNLSWSPISQDSLYFIVSNAVNTSKITISLSPFTYYSLLDEVKTAAAEKNITLELISTNVYEDNRISTITMNGDGTKYLSNDGVYKTINTPTKTSDLYNDSNYITEDKINLSGDTLYVKNENGEFIEFKSHSYYNARVIDGGKY